VCYADAHYNLGSALMEKGRAGEAVAQFQNALQINPGYPGALNNLALILATSEDASVRDGARAVELARPADRLSGAGNPVVLGTLAGAYAEAGNFAGAVETAQRAMDLAQSQGNASLVNTLQGHLKLYRDGQPLRIHR
jgi:protein O-mannosyl-transferase